LQDGGLNDGDGVKNGTLELLGAVSEKVRAKKSSSSGGAVAWPVLLLLGLLVLVRKRQRSKRYT
jgi:hypothetical protein